MPALRFAGARTTLRVWCLGLAIVAGWASRSSRQFCVETRGEQTGWPLARYFWRSVKRCIAVIDVQPCKEGFIADGTANIRELQDACRLCTRHEVCGCWIHDVGPALGAHNNAEAGIPFSGTAEFVSRVIVSPARHSMSFAVCLDLTRVCLRIGESPKWLVSVKFLFKHPTKGTHKLLDFEQSPPKANGVLFEADV